MNKFTIIFLSLLVFTTPIRAQIVTIDPAAITQIIAQLKQAQEQYVLLRDTYDNAISQLEALQSVTDLQDFLNSDAWKDFREYAPEELEDFIAAIESGDEDGLAGAAGEIAEKYGYLESQEYYDDEGVSDGAKQSYTDRVNTAYASEAIADAAYAAASGRVKEFDDIRDKINDAETTKQQLDVIAAIMGELMIVSNETNRLMSLFLKNSINLHKAELEQRTVDRSYTGYDSNLSLDGSGEANDTPYSDPN